MAQTLGGEIRIETWQDVATLAFARRLSRHALAASLAAGCLLICSSADAQPMRYYGGRVISNVEVVQVAWGQGVDPQRLADLATFYPAVLASNYLDWLGEYDTVGKVGVLDGLPGSDQHIGPGTFAGTITITPSNVSTTLDDHDLQLELAAQLDAGSLPAPKLDAHGNVDTLYVLELPKGVSVTLLGTASCLDFYGYHFTITHGGKSVPYAVMPSCGLAFAGETVLRSHELVEAITDTEAGLLPNAFGPTGRPIAWVGDAATWWVAPEAADVCKSTHGAIAGYTVATSWSNAANGCVTHLASGGSAGGSGSGSGGGGSGNGGTGGGGGGARSVAGNGGAGGTGPSGSGGASPSRASDGGCSCRSASGRPPSLAWALVVGLAYARIRRARSGDRAMR